MKAIVCEMCNSHDIVKKDGMYICESCGTKYTLEEAKKMMVDISGSTVKIDTSDKLKNMYEVARRAKSDNNSETAAKYYDMILMEDPSSWEASFYSSYFSAMQCKIMNITSAANKVNNSAVSTVGLIKSTVADEAEQEKALSDIVASCIIIANMFFTSARNTFNGTTFNSAEYQQKHTQEYIDRAVAATSILYAVGNEIEKCFTNEKILKIASVAWQQGITIHEAYRGKLNYNSMTNAKKIIDSYVEKACKYDKDYANKVELNKVNARIAEINKKLSKTNATYRTGAIVGAVFAFIGAYIFYMLYSMNPVTGWMLFAIVCAGLGIFSCCRIPRSKANKQQTKELLENLTKEKEELTQKKAELEKK